MAKAGDRHSCRILSRLVAHWLHSSSLAPRNSAATQILFQHPPPTTSHSLKKQPFSYMSPKVDNWAATRCEPTSIEYQSQVPSDYVIARSIKGKTIGQLCQQVGLDQYDQYGTYKAKVLHKVPDLDANSDYGSYVVVTGVTPTSFGEGKSTTTIGLVQALTFQLKQNSIACIRQPSQGPTFGLKGGAAGGGYSQVWPMDEFNLHLTGDIHAITAANNLIAAAIDARMFHESNQTDEDLYRRLVQRPGSKVPTFTEAQRRRLQKCGINPELEPDALNPEQRRLFARLNIDPDTISVNRVIDTNDRFLRKITVGQAPTEKNFNRITKFTISVASELMAILALAADFGDVCHRVQRMVVGFSITSQADQVPSPITCDDLCITGAVCALIKDAVYPTIVQTLEGSPVLVHCGPFANVAHGNSSIIADKIALDLVGPDGFVVTEAGFASDVGFEKFINIKCRNSGLMPNCAVLVTTIRALMAHGRDIAGEPSINDDGAVAQGLVNLNAHIKNITGNFNVPVVVALNKFSGDSAAHLDFVKVKAIEAGASDCQVTDNWAKGGAGAADLARAVKSICEKSRSTRGQVRLLYPDDGMTILEKLRTVARKVYGASDVEASDAVLDKIAYLEANNFHNLPVCIAKTHLSISHDPKLKGAPKDYIFPIVDINVSAGAGFLYALAGEISTMPGLPTRPAFFDITIDPESGMIDGLF